MAEIGAVKAGESAQIWDWCGFCDLREIAAAMPLPLLVIKDNAATRAMMGCMLKLI